MHKSKVLAFVFPTTLQTRNWSSVTLLSKREQGGLIGAGIGAGAGAFIGGTMGQLAVGALMGGPVGLIAGLLVGDQMTQNLQATQDQIELERLSRERARLNQRSPDANSETESAAESFISTGGRFEKRDSRKELGRLHRAVD